MSRISAAPETMVPRGESVKDSRFEIQFWPTEKLCQREGAPRRFNRRDIAKSEAIIRKFGVRLPLVVRKDGVVLSHYVVVTAARSLGYDELPVVIADDLSETECDQLSLGLTRLYELGQFDSQLLGDMMIEIETSIPDVNSTISALMRPRSTGRSVQSIVSMTPKRTYPHSRSERSRKQAIFGSVVHTASVAATRPMPNGWRSFATNRRRWCRPTRLMAAEWAGS